ncbi:hypothetical protein EJB05_53342, partial [Eragrostis curvula]
MSKQLEVDEEDGGGQGPVFVATATAAKRLRMSPTAEPTSVLYKRSPSPPTSSSLGGGAAGSSSAAEEAPPISAEDWEAVLSGDMPVSTGSQDNNSSFLGWIMDAEDDDAFLFGQIKGPAAAAAFDPFLTAPPPPCQEELQLPHQQLPKEKEEDYCLDGEAAVEELLIEAARRVEAGDSTGARGVLARLNHLLTQSPPPLLRAAAHLRDALLRLVLALPPPPASSSSPFDVALKLAAHKALADASPAVQFASITSTQAFLDALAGARRVHLVDFDVGIASHWPPLMQELAHGQSSMPPPAIKLTALVSPGSHHPLELHLVRDSLTRFAAELGIPFQFNAVLFDPSLPPQLSANSPPGAEAVAVHLPISSGTLSPATLRVVKQLNPAIVVCVEDHGGSCHRGDLPLPHHALNVLRSTAAFLESLDAAGGPADAVAKIEHFILRPRVDRLLLLGLPRHDNQQQLPPWRTMLACAGFAPVQLGSAAEAQAECLLRRTPTQGFHVHNTQAALALRWQRSDLLTVSAWR